MPQADAESPRQPIEKMSNKQLILQMVQRWPEDIAFDQAMYHLEVLKAVIESLREPGDDTDHDEVFEQLLDDEEAHADHLAAKGKEESRGNQEAHRTGRAKDRAQIHSAPQRSRKRA